jgi:hypothetical protein
MDWIVSVNSPRIVVIPTDRETVRNTYINRKVK